MDQTLFEAAVRGDQISLQVFARDNAILNQLTPVNDNILHIAVCFKQAEFVKTVLGMCPLLLYKVNIYGETPLHKAAEFGCCKIASALVNFAKGMNDDVESQQVGQNQRLWSMVTQDKQDTALHIAARNGHPDIVKLLMETDVDLLNVVNNSGESPLFLAVERCHFTIVQHIMEIYPSADCQGTHGMNALHAAIIRTSQARELEFPVPDLSLENIRRIIRDTLLKLHLYTVERQQNQIEIIRLLIGARPDMVKAVDKINWSPLHYAALLGHSEAARLLLQLDSSVAYMSDTDGMSALHVAAMEASVQVMEEITHFCPDACNLVDKKGRTVAHYAVTSGKVKVLRYIMMSLKYEPLLNLADYEGNTLMHLAASDKNRNVLTILADDKRVDKKAMNKNYMKPIDILQLNKHIGELVKATISRKLEQQGGQPSMQGVISAIKIQKEHDERDRQGKLIAAKSRTQDESRTLRDRIDDRAQQGNSEALANFPTKFFCENEILKDKKMRSDELKKISSTHLVVATLIVTITYAAGFTLPGGYRSDETGNGNANLDGKNALGKAILAGKSGFNVFLVADALAFYCSIASVLLHFFISLEEDFHLLLRFTKVAAALTYVSLVGLTIAFAWGVGVALPVSLYGYIIGIGSCCIFFLGFGFI